MDKLAEVQKAIAAEKRKLINKAKRVGIWENFGEKEVRKLQDKYVADIFGGDRAIGDLIFQFSEWSMNVTDKDIKGV